MSLTPSQIEKKLSNENLDELLDCGGPSKAREAP